MTIDNRSGGDTITWDQIELMESLLVSFHEKDSASLAYLLVSIQKKYQKGEYSNGYEVFEDFGVDSILVENYLANIDTALILQTNWRTASDSSYVMNADFEVIYMEFIEKEKSVIWEYNKESGKITARGWIRDLWKNPCGFGATMSMTAANAGHALLAGASAALTPVTGVTILGVVSNLGAIGGNIYGYIKECL